MKDFPSLSDYGGKADDFTDNLPAFKAALAEIKSESNPHLFIPGGGYAMSGTLNVHQPVRLYGPLGGPNFGGAVLRFPENVPGIVVHERRTTDDGGGLASGDAGLGDAAGSIIEKLTIVGGMAQSLKGPWTNPKATNPGASGIWIRGHGVQVRDVWTGCWSGHGIQVNATSGAMGAQAGNANNFDLDRIFSWYNQGDAFCVFGSDANAGNIRACSGNFCAGAGFRDYPFLGNSYWGCHVEACGLLDPNEGNAPTPSCAYNGKSYYVAPMMENAASTVVPGTDNTVWVPLNGNASRQWEPGLEWIFGGTYITNPRNEDNSQTKFDGCYQESGQPPAYVRSPACITFGNMGVNGVTGDGLYLFASGNNGTPVGARAFAAGDGNRVVQYGGNGGGYFIDASAPANGDFPARNVQMTFDQGFFGGGPDGPKSVNFMREHSASPMAITVDDPGSQIGPDAVVVRKLFVGPNWPGSRLGMTWSLDALIQAENGKEVGQGSFFLCTDPSPGSPIGFRCSRTGMIGSTAVFETIGVPGSVGTAGPAGPVL